MRPPYPRPSPAAADPGGGRGPGRFTGKVIKCPGERTFAHGSTSGFSSPVTPPPHLGGPMRIPARRAVLAVVSAVAPTLLVSGGAAASLGAPASTGSPAGAAGPGGTGALASPGAPANYEFVDAPSMA